MKIETIKAITSKDITDVDYDEALAFGSWMKEYAQPYREMMTFYNCAIMEIETKFKVLDRDLSLHFDRNPIESIESRLKSPESLMKKMIRKKYPLTLSSIVDNVHDIGGVRVVCSFTSDIYMLADMLLKQDDITLIKTKDYIKHPKENGYRSLHLIISVPIFLHNEKREMKVEVQLRTLAMDLWASSEHRIRYKKDYIASEEENALLLECSKMCTSLDERFESAYRKMIQNQTEKCNAQEISG